MGLEQYEVVDWEAWAMPTGTRANGLRITTAADLPFSPQALLRVRCHADGLEFYDDDENVSVLFAPKLKEEVITLFNNSLALGIPVALTEVHFYDKEQKTWLARAVDAQR